MVRKYLDLSTDHLPPHDAELLAGAAENGGTVERTADGFWVWCGTADTNPDATLRENGYTEAFLRVLAHARGLDCDRVLFDRDASDIAELPVFHHEDLAAHVAGLTFTAQTEGEDCLLIEDVAEFIKLNADESEITAEHLASLEVGDSFKVGGGAAPLVTLKREPDTKAVV